MARRTAPDRPLRVGLNLLFLGERAGGVGRYGRALAPALLAAEPATEITVFASSSAPADLRAEPWSDRVRWVTLPVSPTSPLVQPAQFAALPVLAAARRLDVLHSPANVGPGLTPGVTSVVSVMDLIWREHADEWNADPRAQRSMARWVQRSLRHADGVLAISETAAAQLVAELGVAPTRLSVTPLGVEEAGGPVAAAAALRERLSLGGDQRVLLCVAQKRPYKNQAALVRALPALPDDVVLVAPGAPTAYEAQLRAVAASLGVADRVRLPGWLTEPELAGLYRLAELFALPTLTEGFGLPVLEAMAHGTPVACSDIPVLREVAGDAAAYFDPRSDASVAATLAGLLADPARRAELATRGAAQAARFTWRRTGEATLAGYQRAIDARLARR